MRRVPIGDYFIIGMVARNEHGVTIWWARKVVPGRPQPSEGEATAVLFSVQTACRQGWKQLIVERDCQPVHQAPSRRDFGLTPFGAILEGCLDLSYFFISLSFTFVRCSGNSIAHAIVTDSRLSCNQGAFLPSILKI